jgi:hypothetical protein
MEERLAHVSSTATDPVHRAEATRAASWMLALAGSFEAQGCVGRQEMSARRALLRESLISVARAVTGEPAIGSLEEATDALAAHAARTSRAMPPPPAGWNPRTLAADGEPDAESLRAAERWIGALLPRARSNVREPRRFRWTILAALALVLLVAVPATAQFWYHPAQLDYTWRTSSAETGFQSNGKLGDDPQSYDLLFHTREEPFPWVLVDMLKPRKIDRVVLRNRLDCCTDRGVPLVVEVSLDGLSFEAVAQQDGSFGVWTAHFTRRPARYVRIRSLRTTALHLRRIELP